MYIVYDFMLFHITFFLYFLYFNTKRVWDSENLFGDAGWNCVYYVVSYVACQSR